MKVYLKAAIISTLITLLWAAIFTFIMIVNLNNGSTIEVYDYFIVPIIGYGPLIAPIILWTKAIKAKELKNIKIGKGFYVLLIDVGLFALSFLIKAIFKFDVKTQLVGYLIVEIITFYFRFWGTTIFLYFAYREENESRGLTIAFSIIFVLLGQYGTSELLWMLSDLQTAEVINPGVSFQGWMFVINAYIPIVTLISCIIKNNKLLPNWSFIIIFIAGPLVALAVPILFMMAPFIGGTVGAATSYSDDYEIEYEEVEEEKYYIDGREVERQGSGASEVYVDSSGNMYKDDGHGTCHEVDDPYDD